MRNYDRTAQLLRRIIETDGIKKIQDAILATVSGTVDISDKPTRELGKVYGDQGLPVKQEAGTGELHVKTV